MLEKIVKTNKFKSVGDMKERIALLEDLKSKQEDILKFDLIEIYKTLQPAELVKSAIDNIREDVEVSEKATGLAGSLGLNYIISRVMGKNKGPIGYLKAVAVQEVVNFLYRKNEKAIHNFIGKITNKAMRKLHIVEDEIPEYSPVEEVKDDMHQLEKEENRDMKEAQLEKPKEKKETPEPTKNKSLTDPTPGPQKDAGK